MTFPDNWHWALGDNTFHLHFKEDVFYCAPYLASFAFDLRSRESGPIEPRSQYMAMHAAELAEVTKVRLTTFYFANLRLVALW